MDFIIRSVQDLLRREFDASLNDEGVHILDPFVGTGTFITRLMQSGYIDKDALLRKYASELHANEIMLLAYYIAAVNIETTYAEIAGEYQPFEGIVLTDTFQLQNQATGETRPSSHATTSGWSDSLGLDIRVIIGNPPWSRGAGRHDDDNANQRYPTLDEKIANSYIARSDSTGLKNALYDSYVRAVRWASDRVQVGRRRHHRLRHQQRLPGRQELRRLPQGTSPKEFHEIYIYDLRGNQRTSGETSTKRGRQRCSAAAAVRVWSCCC